MTIYEVRKYYDLNAPYQPHEALAFYTNVNKAELHPEYKKYCEYVARMVTAVENSSQAFKDSYLKVSDCDLDIDLEWQSILEYYVEARKDEDYHKDEVLEACLPEFNTINGTEIAIFARDVIE